MSGFGERFRRAGYTIPKPLIEIEGKPIIAHVIDLFPGETDFIFICNQQHLDEPDYRMHVILQHYCPSTRVIGIAPHKLGPINAVRQAEHLLDPQLPVVVNYCDFTCYWDWQHFKQFITKNQCAGAIPAYRGFHPHSLGNTNYAYMQEIGGWVQDIQEKQPIPKTEWMSSLPAARITSRPLGGRYTRGRMCQEKMSQLQENDACPFWIVDQCF